MDKSPIVYETKAVWGTVRIQLLILLALGLLAVAGFHFIEHLSLVDAIYLMVMSLTTTGFSDVRPVTMAGRIFTSVLLLFGLTVITFAVRNLVGAVLSPEFREAAWSRRMAAKAERMDNHIIVCGLGRMGRQATEQLRHKNLGVVVIEQSRERAKWAEDKGLPVIVGNASDDRTLLEAGVERARGLITCVSNDADNVVITLSTKAINPKVTVVARCATEEIHRKLMRVGADRVVSPYEIGGRRMAYALLYPTVVEFMDEAMRAEQIELTVEELRVAPHSALCGKTIANSEIHKKTGALIVGVKMPDGKMISNPPGHHVLNEEQILIVLGNPGQLGQLDKALSGQVQHVAPTFE